MPKLGMEPIRRRALIDATIAVIGETGGLDVTVGQIAKRAGMSSGLAHHYFGNKDQMLLAAMRDILARLGALVRTELARAKGPRGRIVAIIEANLEASHFDQVTMSAWLNFYVQALQSDDAQRLMQVYAGRLRSNLLYDLRKLNVANPELTAHGIAALIDGVYLRQALEKGAPSRDDAVVLVKSYLDAQLAQKGSA